MSRKKLKRSVNNKTAPDKLKCSLLIALFKVSVLTPQAYLLRHFFQSRNKMSRRQLSETDQKILKIRNLRDFEKKEGFDRTSELN